MQLVKNASNFVKILPDPDDIVIHASVEADIIDGTKLHDIWHQVVTATHPDYAFLPQAEINKSIFMPLDLDRFMAIRCRAVSGLSKWGPNSNGDGFPNDELINSYLTFIAKGFYVEHASNDPRNAIGILAHAQWIEDEQYVLAVALVDKMRFPREANMIRASLESGKAGVSMGCIAGAAECSICHNIAKKKHQLCAHMNRENPNCIKGRKASNGSLAYDICRDVTFYELSFTKAPADREALSLMVQGADNNDEAAAEPGQPVAVPTIAMPDQKMLEQWIEKAVREAFMSRYKKMVKDEVYRQLEKEIKEKQLELKPAVTEMVETKREQLIPA